VHEGDGEHYHDIGERVGGYDEIVVWTTAGFDVGSSTTQAVFSRITLARQDAYYAVIDRSVLHESEVILTPYCSPEIIDKAKLSEFIARQYAQAQLEPHEVDTGAVILTGLALSTTNSRAIAESIADESGRFVAVAAGDILEARLAASGAGVPALSAKRRGVLVHIDIGGGTTKLSAWRAGKLLGLAALDIGARLVTFNEAGEVIRVEGPATRVAADLRLELEAGARLDTAVAERIAGALARNVLRHAGVLREAPRGQSLLRTEPLFRDEPPRIEAVVFTGGVSEYVYRRETRTFGDLGLLLGRAVRAEVDAAEVKLLPFERGIRATVLGASQHSAQLSGNTIYISDTTLLPLRNVPVLLPKLDLEPEKLNGSEIQRHLSDVLALHTSADAARAVAIALTWKGAPTLERLTCVARACAAALESHLGRSDPCIVIVEGDVAGILGARLAQAFGKARPVICLDGVHVHEFDHIDLGSLIPRTGALPVIVKSLLFAATARKSHQYVRHQAPVL
jgi:ethanolamine utilization protein EutA